MPIYNTPSSTCQTMPPIARRCQPNTRCATPAKTSSQATTMFTAIPAATGRPMARTPARIMRRLTAIDKPVKFLASAAIVEVAMGSSTEEMLGMRGDYACGLGVSIRRGRHLVVRHFLKLRAGLLTNPAGDGKRDLCDGAKGGKRHWSLSIVIEDTKD